MSLRHIQGTPGNAPRSPTTYTAMAVQDMRLACRTRANGAQNVPKKGREAMCTFIETACTGIKAKSLHTAVRRVL